MICSRPQQTVHRPGLEPVVGTSLPGIIRLQVHLHFIKHVSIKDKLHLKLHWVIFKIHAYTCRCDNIVL